MVQIHTKNGIEDLTWEEAKTKYGIEKPMNLKEEIENIKKRLDAVEAK